MTVLTTVVGTDVVSMTVLTTVVGTLLFAVLGPVVGCLLAGLDRKVSARMQGRVGPPLLQPYYDVRKLLAKERAAVSPAEGAYVACSLLFALIAGGIFFSGGNLLLSVFAVTLSGLMLIVAAYSSRSPYAELGAHREALQVMAYEPMVLLMAVAFFLAAGSFDSSAAFALPAPAVVAAWPAFLGLLFVLTIKLRKSPFDLSMSHHAHQEIVRGLTTEMSGRTLAMVEVAHWCESVLFLGWTGLFLVCAEPISWPLAVLACVLIWLLEIWIDNNFARVKWQFMLKSAWAVALVAGGLGVAALTLL